MRKHALWAVAIVVLASGKVVATPPADPCQSASVAKRSVAVSIADIYGSVGPATLHESGKPMSVIPVSRSPERSRRGSRGIAPRPREAC